MDVFHTTLVVYILHTELFLYFFNTRFQDRNMTFFDVHRVVLAFDEFRHKAGKGLIQFAAVFIRRGDDEWRPGFVDEDRVHFIHDGKPVLSLRHLLGSVGHIITKIIKAIFVVGAVGYVSLVGIAALDGLQKLMDNPETAFGVSFFVFGLGNVGLVI